MKIAGFTFIKNAIKFDYPIIESINSILPICDEFVIAVGKSDDDTLKLIEGIKSDKIRIIHTVWDESKREGGVVLAAETDKAFAAISEDTDWAIYIQGDEVIHEKYLDTIYENMVRYKDDLKVDGLLFKYLHFFGSYDYVGRSSQWYKHEIRVVRYDKSVYSYRDAQGFRKGDNEKLVVKPIDAYVYHYGWVKDPRTMKSKQLNAIKYYRDDEWIDKNIAKGDEFDYSNIDCLLPFDGTHPQVMTERIKARNWKFDHDISRNKIRLKERFKGFMKKYLGWNLDYQNYILS
ncbi:MAG: glycosyl transferase [Bacteroidetes bacterium GWF2_40_14]|nr:MAG: glycosyl transferase [Bacteroidetes bacterium GWF2_40_14]